MKNLLIALFLFTTLTASAQSVFNSNIQLNWDDTPVVHSIYPDEESVIPQFNIYRFGGANYDKATPTLPYYSVLFDVPSYGRLRASLSDEVWEAFDKEDSKDDKVLAEYVNLEAEIAKERLQYKGTVRFIPIRKTSTGFERLISFNLNVRFNAESDPYAGSSREDYPTFSVLSDADENPVYKIKITETGMYKLDKAYLDDLGINTNDIDPRQIKIYGNGGGMMPEMINEPRYNDLEENPIKVIGEEDGSFDNGDAVIFYAEGPHIWEFDEENAIFDRKTNIYDSENYYFLKISPNNGLRVSDLTLNNLTNPSYTTSEFSAYKTFEEDILNLLDQFNQGYGTGQMWFGDSYKLQRDRTYTDAFEFPNITNDPATIKVVFAARAGNSNTKLTIKVDGNTFTSSNFNSASLSNVDSQYAWTKSIINQYIPTTSTQEVTLEYPNVGTSEGWLDYITINARRQLKMAGDVLAFRDHLSAGESVSKFNLEATGEIEIWDITNPIKPALQANNNNAGQISFGSDTSDELREFIAFRPGATLNVPEKGTVVGQQNLHSISGVDMLIVYHPSFASQAFQLAEHRADYDDLSVATAEIGQVFNEFSSGKTDPAAIREMAKMLFERNPNQFKYLLLFGDGSFDARGIALAPGETAHNYIPVYETRESLNPISGYPSDDFYGLISPGEGTTNLTGLLDVAVGRIPVRTASKAQAMVDKIIAYDTDKESMGDWRNRIVHIADNGDSNVHQRDSDEIAEKARNENKNLNIDKIYLDAYQRVATTGDARVPAANEALNNSIFKGNLAVIYLGHGGPGGWTQERVLRKEDIFSWENSKKLPLFMTATCTFAGYDSASDVSAGEEVFLNEEGGAIALYSTVRPVFASQNADLTDSAAFKLFRDPASKRLPMGEVLRLSKNTFNANSPTNQRKFQMIGDPAQRLAIPQLNVVTTKINNLDVSQGILDTLNALERVTIEGEIRNTDGSLATDFNGIIYPTIFDKIKSLTTLGQISGASAMPYLLRKNVIFKGRASVTAGQFVFTFVVPKDIDFNFGAGKISYYAADEDNMIDAAGASCDLIIGGINEDALTDDQGPEVEVFMNTFEWVSGGNTNENPTLLARLSDDLGINVVGNSIGHDLTGLLDNNSQNSYLLNDFYEADLDDYTSGTVRFPLKDLEPGFHEIRVKAWDTANNPAEGSTEFIVAESAEIALTNVLNYPNPFVNRTCFMFDHNQSGDLDVLVNIYSISGRLVKTLEERVDGSTGKVTRDNCIEWDGKDDFGDDLARGVYLYKVRIRNTETGTVSDKKESEFEKLVIIK